MTRKALYNKIRKLIGNKEHIFDTVIELHRGSTNHQITNIISEGIYIVKDDDVNDLEFVKFDDITLFNDLVIILVTLNKELSV